MHQRLYAGVRGALASLGSHHVKGLAHSWLPVLSRTAWSGPNIWMTNTFSLSDLAWQPTSLPRLTTAGRERGGGARAFRHGACALWLTRVAALQDGRRPLAFAAQPAQACTRAHRPAAQLRGAMCAVCSATPLARQPFGSAGKRGSGRRTTGRAHLP